MHIPVCCTWLCEAVCIVIRLLDDVIYFTLLGGKLTTAWICTCEVLSVMSVALGTGIDYEQTARSDDLVVAVVVEGLPVLGEDCRE